MNNQNEKFSLQGKTKPKPEELIPQILSPEKQVVALDFIAWLRANKLSPKWNATNKFRADSKGKLMCYVTLFPLSNAIWWQVLPPAESLDEWEIWINIHEQDFYADCPDNIKQFVWNHVNTCKGCRKCHHNTMERTIGGKKFTNICHYGGGMVVKSPDVQTLEVVKELLLINK